MEEKVDIINYKKSDSFFLWCETYNKSWFEVKRDTYTKCKDKMREFEDKFGDSIQLEILYEDDEPYEIEKLLDEK